MAEFMTRFVEPAEVRRDPKGLLVLQSLAGITKMVPSDSGHKDLYDLAADSIANFRTLYWPHPEWPAAANRTTQAIKQDIKYWEKEGYTLEIKLPSSKPPRKQPNSVAEDEESGETEDSNETEYDAAAHTKANDALDALVKEIENEHKLFEDTKAKFLAEVNRHNGVIKVFAKRRSDLQVEVAEHVVKKRRNGTLKRLEEIEKQKMALELEERDLRTLLRSDK